MRVISFQQTEHQNDQYFFQELGWYLDLSVETACRQNEREF